MMLVRFFIRVSSVEISGLIFEPLFRAYGLSEFVTFNDKDFVRCVQVTTYKPEEIASGRASILNS
ncbi:hypothetical protein Pr1d_50750 [Bythopirellula goksoeyrii]|uniref:Uncharacterized protein n=1 Tax=Bythopirellula goksoeyrii TaxID=1400387 RepID=A0A5B9QFD4_9BACT|nr:hypothetical protein Pr1d_50750 [Bythopirellula goksoeyrii]